MSENISLDDAAAARSWFAEVVEPLADSFEAANVERYVHLFAGILARAGASPAAAELVDRYQRIRHSRPFAGPDPDDVFVLSRVTLGADVAITSVVLDAARHRFPRARIWFVGSTKGYELFARDPRIGYLPAPYDRTGTVRDRIAASQALGPLLDRPESIVIDPDSRLTQLGLVPICPEDRYFFFESRSPAGPGTLGDLACRWAERTFGIRGSRAYIAPPGLDATAADITVSLGVGENPAKRIADPFERNLMEALAALARPVLVDQGAGGEESARVARATAGLPNIRLFAGAFAAFASHVAASRAYVGYDSAGQHAAAACGTPLVAIFCGYPNERFLERWRPSGPGPVTVLRAGEADPVSIATEVAKTLR